MRQDLLLEERGHIWIVLLHHLDKFRQTVDRGDQTDEYCGEDSAERGYVGSASHVKTWEWHLEQVQEIHSIAKSERTSVALEASLLNRFFSFLLNVHGRE